MKAVILAGGKGTRFPEETKKIPKPMITIGEKPIIWHIMKYFSCFDVKDFIICCGYKGEIIKEYFFNYLIKNNSFTINLKDNTYVLHNARIDNWKITFLDTGLNTMTGGRLKKVEKFIKKEKFFYFTYGDGLSNINLYKLKKFHIKHKMLATVTSVKAPPRYGVINFDKKYQIKTFSEKKPGNEGYINGGYFILTPKCLEFIKNDKSVWEEEPISKLIKLNQINSYRHDDFWQSMDSIRDHENLEKLWNSGRAKWKIWKS